MSNSDANARLVGILIEPYIRRGILPRPLSPADDAHCKRLSLQWLSSAGLASNAVPLAPPPSISQGLLSTIHSLDRQMDIYEDADLLDHVLTLMPIQVLYERAEDLQSGDKPLPSLEDALADVTVHWFKEEFFRWADPVKCPACSGETAATGLVPPNPEERQGRAGRVELHLCKAPSCGGAYRFPRYNDLSALLRSRIGRCGEFANLFTLILRALGLRARYVWCAEDHVWNEYYSSALSRWVHLDSCEAARDQPLLYDRGWGKKMSYVFAFSTDGPQDVSRGYIIDWDAALQRRKQSSEEALERCLMQAAQRRRVGLSSEILRRLRVEDEGEKTWLIRSKEVAEEEKAHGRESGTKEWKEDRGETGE